MIAIFNTRQRANAFSNKIDAFLRANRQGYNADRWSDENKSDNDELWAVKIHPDIDELDNRFNLDMPANSHNIVEFVDVLPDNWRNDEII